MGSIWEKPFFTWELSLVWWNSPSERKVPLSSATYIYINCATIQYSTETYILFHAKHNSILRFRNWNNRIWTDQTGTLQGGLASADGDSRKWKWFQNIFCCLSYLLHIGAYLLSRTIWCLRRALVKRIIANYWLGEDRVKTIYIENHSKLFHISIF